MEKLHLLGVALAIKESKMIIPNEKRHISKMVPGNKNFASQL